MSVIKLNNETNPTDIMNGDVAVNNTSNNETVIHNDNADNGEARVVLNGPLSNIYTKALNLVYANESVNMVTTAVQTIVENEEEDRANPDNGLYLYCCGSDLNHNQLLEGTNKLRVALDSKKFKQVIVAVEDGDNRKVALLKEFGAAIGAKVCLGRQSAMAAVKDALRG